MRVYQGADTENYPPLCVILPYEIDIHVIFNQIILRNTGNEAIVLEEIGRALYDLIDLEFPTINASLCVQPAQSRLNWLVLLALPITTSVSPVTLQAYATIPSCQS
jgi:hypothetical protein